MRTFVNIGTRTTSLTEEWRGLTHGYLVRRTDRDGTMSVWFPATEVEAARQQFLRSCKVPEIQRK